MDAEVAQISLLVTTSLSHEKVRFRDETPAHEEEEEEEGRGGGEGKEEQEQEQEQALSVFNNTIADEWRALMRMRRMRRMMLHDMCE